MNTSYRHNISIYEHMFQKISHLAKKENRSVTKMTEILLEQALEARGLQD